MTELQRARQQRKNPTKGRGNPAKEREEMPERGERLAGRTAMQAPGRLEGRAQEEPTEKRAQVRTEESAEVGAEERAEEAREEAMEEAMEEAIKAVARGSSFVEKPAWYGRLAAEI